MAAATTLEEATRIRTEAKTALERAEAIEKGLNDKRGRTSDPNFTGTPQRPADTALATTGAVGKSGSFSLTKAMAARLGFVSRESAKDDLHAADLFAKSLRETNCAHADLSPDEYSIKYPICTDYLPSDVTDHKDFKVYKAMERAGQSNYDPDEARWVIKKSDLSYLVDTLGGYTVPPPVQGEIIDLIRPIEAMMRAGATTVPLPPNGRISFPRLTGTSTAYWTNENTSITQSNQTFGQVNLQAKKLADYVQLPNELLKYSGVAIDSIVKSEMAKSLALAFDYACFYGIGSAMQPKGLTLYTGTNQLIAYEGLTPAPKGIGADGNTIRPEDGYRMAGLIEDRFAAIFEGFGWICRPTLANNLLGFRADAAAPADAAGTFVQSMMRLFGDRVGTASWCGYPVTKSAVLVNNLVKGGSGATLVEMFGGIWSAWLLGMYGVVDIATSSQAGTTFQADQTAVRALMLCDAAPRQEGAFIRYGALKNTTN